MGAEQESFKLTRREVAKFKCTDYKISLINPNAYGSRKVVLELDYYHKPLRDEDSPFNPFYSVYWNHDTDPVAFFGSVETFIADLERDPANIFYETTPTFTFRTGIEHQEIEATRPLVCSSIFLQNLIKNLSYLRLDCPQGSFLYEDYPELRRYTKRMFANKPLVTIISRLSQTDKLTNFVTKNSWPEMPSDLVKQLFTTVGERLTQVSVQPPSKP